MATVEADHLNRKSSHHDSKCRCRQQKGGNPGGHKGDLGLSWSTHGLGHQGVGDDKVPATDSSHLLH